MEVFDLSDKTERVLLVGVQENDEIGRAHV